MWKPLVGSARRGGRLTKGEGDGESLPAGNVACALCGFSNPAGNRFCGSCGAALARVVGPSAAGYALPGRAPPERRHLTVLFSDLVDSTKLSNLLDPEDVHP